jgi:hypothetical protein
MLQVQFGIGWQSQNGVSEGAVLNSLYPSA